MYYLHSKKIASGPVAFLGRLLQQDGPGVNFVPFWPEPATKQKVFWWTLSRFRQPSKRSRSLFLVGREKFLNSAAERGLMKFHCNSNTLLFRDKIGRLRLDSTFAPKKKILHGLAVHQRHLFELNPHRV